MLDTHRVAKSGKCITEYTELNGITICMYNEDGLHDDRVAAW